jgi:hypothetical protein
VRRPDDSPRRPFVAWAPVLALTAPALWLRLRGLPGPWGTDALAYFESIRHGPAAGDPRGDRRLFLALVEGALRLGDWRPEAASLPGVVASAAVVPVLWLALRRRLGDVLALLPCLLWTFLGSDLEEVAEISADAMLALPAALAAWGVVAAARRPDGRVLPLAAAGVALGVGAVLKETMLLAVVGFGVGALAIGRGRERVRNAATIVAAALVVFAVGLIVTPDRLATASASVAAAGAPVRPASPEFLHRLTVGIPELLLTATRSYGLLFIVAIPLLARLPFRAFRGDPLAATALAGFLAFAVLPVSLRSWALLPAQHARYFLCLMPVLLAALVDALRERAASRPERWIGALAAVVGLVFVRGSPWARVLVPPGLVLAAWPSLPEAVTRLLSERTRLALAAAVFLAAEVAWAAPSAAPDAVDWAVAAAAAFLVLAPWLVGRDAGAPTSSFAIAAGLVLAVATTRSRFVADREWTAWSRLPTQGRVFADELLARRLRAAAVAAHADPSRIALVDAADDLPADPRPDDRVLARDAGPLGGGFGLAEACRDPGSGWARTADDLGEAAMFQPAR